ncbi:MAG: type I restriction endonuclease subunit R [Bacilli bacterium]
MSNELNIISENMNSTVVTEYEKIATKSKSYQSEDELEKEFIKTLQSIGYEYLIFNSEKELIDNLRKQLEKLNNYTFSDSEWNNLFNNYIANKNDGIVDKARTIQKDYIKTLNLDDGRIKNIYFIDKSNIHNNTLQVINQYENIGSRDNRYDVTLLVNGFPLVHLELKNRGKNLREAFNQIDRYQRDSFWAGCGLYEYIQIFIISNGTYTKYYSNTTRDLHLKNKNTKSSNTFEFTSYWADQHNKVINDLVDFARTFCTKHTLLNILTKYCVFTSGENLMAMRPYQIVATEKILNKIEIAHNYKYYGFINAGGYVWHTTGSGKTLTSFKTAQLATNLDYIDNVLFVVDRKDLDYQTMKEYDSFEKGAANSNSSTAVLKKQLENDSRIIITTIQKLSSFIKKYNDHEIYNKHIVFIFDECHRSQFGDMHKMIIKKFNKYYMFGFTGTPIFANNATSKKGVLQTTEQTFGDKLHTYTIVNAINDKNVLPFKYEYVSRVDVKDDIKDEKVYGIDVEKAFDNKIRISLITDYIINNFDRKTKTGNYMFKSLDNVEALATKETTNEQKTTKVMDGFNSIFAVSSIDMAKKYYEAFKYNSNNKLKIALIYSYGVNDAIDDGLFDENNESTENLTQSDRDYLDYAIKDYNNMFGTSYDTSSDKFQNYYKDVSLRMKNKEIDLLIVVNMFLTGFDAKTLNTLWVDKNLNYHGLIQAFSRTNRILNSIKVCGNIVSFRNLEDNLNDAIALFGDENASSIVLLRPYNDYYNGYQDESKREFPGYVKLVQDLLDKYPAGQMITGEQNNINFVKLYSAILKAGNILSSFDEFVGNEILTPRQIEVYHGMYQNVKDEIDKLRKVDKRDIAPDLVFEMELIKTIDINIDYILALVKKYHDSNMEDKEILISINNAIDASPELRNKKDLIQEFINSLNVDSDVFTDFTEFMNSKKKEELDILIKEENLEEDETYDFIRKSFERGNVETNGTEVSSILPPMSRFSADNERLEKKTRVIDKIIEFFDKFFNISNKGI